MACSRLLSVTATPAHAASISASFESTCPARATSRSSRSNWRDDSATGSPSFVRRRGGGIELERTEARTTVGTRQCIPSTWEGANGDHELVAAEPCVSLGRTAGPIEAYPGHEVRLGELSISRMLPVRDKRPGRPVVLPRSLRPARPSRTASRWTSRRIRTSACRRSRGCWKARSSTTTASGSKRWSALAA